MVEKWGVFLIDQRLYPNKPVQAISNCYYPLLTLFIWKMIANMIIQVVNNCQSILLSINISASEDNGHDVIQKKNAIVYSFFFQFTFIVYHLFLQSLCKNCADFEYLVSNAVNNNDKEIMLYNWTEIPERYHAQFFFIIRLCSLDKIRHFFFHHRVLFNHTNYSFFVFDKALYI